MEYGVVVTKNTEMKAKVIKCSSKEEAQQVAYQMYLQEFTSVPCYDSDFTYFLQDNNYGQIFYGLEEIKIRLCEFDKAA